MAQVVIKNISKSYDGKVKVLDGLDLNIASGEKFFLLGPSGCGKSTFLRSINRMNELSPDFSCSGNIYLEGEEIHGKDVVELRKRVGMVFQKANPFAMSIFDNVAYGLRLHGGKTKKEINQRSIRKKK